MTRRQTPPQRGIALGARALLTAALLITALPAASLIHLASAAEAGSPALKLDWNASQIRNTYSVAWGDYDGDGDLDLVAGNLADEGQLPNLPPNQLFRNEDGELVLDRGWTPQPNNTRSVAWGDYDADGDLDLAVGNSAVTSGPLRDRPEPLQIYTNGPDGLSDLPAVTLSNSSRVRSVAWGDYDGDGWLDLAVAVDGVPTPPEPGLRLYRNTGAGFADVPALALANSAKFVKAAWADADGDGDLDLAAAGLVGQSQLFINCTRSNAGCGAPVAFGDAQSLPLGLLDARDLAWGDLDGDRDPDLVVASDGPDSWVLLNTCAQNGQFPSPTCSANGVGFAAAQVLPTSPAQATGGALAVALADQNGDGSLDVALGREVGSNLLLLNDGSGSFAAADWQPPQVSTAAVAWGDVNGDGRPDLAIANRSEPIQLYRNENSVLRTTAVPGDVAVVNSDEDSAGVAWGDVDRDGDLDLAVANTGAPSRLYLNCTLTNGGAPCAAAAPVLRPAAWQTPAAAAVAVAWGDADRDGDLDLAVANEDTGFTLIYRGCAVGPDAGCAGSPLSTVAAARLATPSVSSIAWGDLENDGDLDLAVGSNGAASVVHVNCLAAPPAAGCSSDALRFANTAVRLEAGTAGAVAWGDYDQDGDLDLLLANINQPSRLFRNDSGRLTPDEGWTPDASSASAAAWGDYDRDGDLDLALGNYGGPSQIYRNNLDSATGARRLVLDIDWVPAPARTTALAWADADGDGDLDLALGNDRGDAGSSPSLLYLNDGEGDLTLAASLDSDAVQDLAWGDLDNDGLPDLAVGGTTQGQSLEIFRNDSGNAGPLDSPTQVHVRQPGGPAANLLAGATVLEATTIAVPFTLKDRESDPVGHLRAEYSLDGGGQWLEARGVFTSPADTPPGAPFPTSPAGVGYTFTWNSFESRLFGQSDTVVLRILAYPTPWKTAPTTAGQFRRANATPGALISPFSTGTTASVRVRGAQVRVLSGGEPVVGAVVYRLPSNAQRDAEPIGSGGRPFTTDSQGYLQGRGPIELNDRLAALKTVPITETVALTQTVPLTESVGFTLYRTSPIDLVTGLPTTVVTQAGVQTIEIAPSAHLMALDLDVSLEWDARTDEQFISQLRFDLERAGELLYDWTDGQVTLGAIEIYHAAENWDSADIRIYATNRLRPRARQGGIVSEVTADPEKATNGQYYEPGQVHMGAVWTRYGGAVGTLGEDWPRALAHEIGHYALFLDDNYLGRGADGRLISVPAQLSGQECVGAMTNPYRDDYSEFQTARRAPSQPSTPSLWEQFCMSTLSQVEAQRADWETIKAFFPVLRPPAFFNQQPGPAALTLKLTTIREDGPAPSERLLEVPIFTLVRPDGSRFIYQPGSRVRAILYKRPPNGGAVRAIDLGRPNLDQIFARGAEAGDRLCVYDQRAAGAEIGCAIVDDSVETLAVATFTGWAPDLRVTPVTTRSLTISIPRASVGTPAPAALRARVIPADGESPPQEFPLELQNGAYTRTFSFAELMVEAAVQVWDANASDTQARREIVTDYVAQFGVAEPPAPAPEIVAPFSHKKPGKSCTNNCSNGAPVTGSSDGQLLIESDPLPNGKFYAIQTVTSLPAAPRWSVAVGQGYRLSTSLSAEELRARRVSITLGYLDAELPAGSEGGLGIFRWDEAAGSWRALASSRFDPERNEISANADGGGIYALMTTLAVRPGWNMFAYPWQTALPVEAALQQAANASPRGDYTTVYSYARSGQAGVWQVYDVDAPPWVNDLSTLRYGQGYWINVVRGATIAAATARPNQVSPLPVPPATYYGVLSGLPGPTPTAGQLVRAFIDGKECARTTTVTVSSGGKSVVGFVIKVPSALERAGCGQLGSVVSFTIGERPLITPTVLWDNNRPQNILNRLILPLLYR
jgi:hypothetical protein